MNNKVYCEICKKEITDTENDLVVYLGRFLTTDVTVCKECDINKEEKVIELLDKKEKEYINKHNIEITCPCKISIS